MKPFLSGIVLGITLTAAAGGFAASQDPLGLGRSEHQRRYDYFRERAAQLDIKALRENADRRRIERSQRRPCE
jgi:hypothetical protein